MTLFVGISELVQPHGREGAGRAPLEVVRDAALWVEDGRIVATGPRSELESQAGRSADRGRGAARAETERVDLGGRAVVPGLVDSHTHVVFAGDRVDEMGRRARGETYEQIAAAGGGIASSVAQLAGTAEDEVLRQSEDRVRLMLARGTTTIEVKSGYGLEPERELAHLRAVQALAARTPVQILATVLAHIVPPSARSDRQAFVTRFADDVIAPAAAKGLARYCDVFVENGAFTAAEARRLTDAAHSKGLAVKLHVDQLRDGGGAALAAEVGALSADHLEYTSDAGRRALAAAGVVATILPGCALFLGKGPWPDGRALRDAGCEVAIATDCNPGSSHITDLCLCATLAATRCGLSLEEALWGATAGGARALGLSDRGTLRSGERADFVVVDHRDWRALLYRPGAPPIHSVYIAGASVSG